MRVEIVYKAEYTDDLYIPTKFVFDTNDASAVKVIFMHIDPPISWVFHRDLLAAGLFEHVGEGDVKVWPEDPGKVAIHLSSPDGQAVVRFTKPQIFAFVKACYMAVPQGAEFQEVDWDTEITKLTE